MSDSNSFEIKSTGSHSLLENLRKFRFQKKPVKKMNTSDEDSNLTSSGNQIRRKPVNRIEDSDSDVGSPTKLQGSMPHVDNKPETKEREEKFKYLSTLYPRLDAPRILEALNNSNWQTDEAERQLNSQRKRLGNKPLSSSKKKRRKVDYDEDVDNDSDEKNYKNRVFDSDDDSDAAVSNELTSDKKSVLDFMQNALHMELLLMSHCSQKRANAIIEARPFHDWRDLVQKFQNYRYLDTELLNSAQVLLGTRHVVDTLMKKCLRLSSILERAVAAGATNIRQQPAGIPSGLNLASYQMVGINWLAVLHAQNVNGILADEMGLGKTVQVITFLTYLKEAGLAVDGAGPHLIVVPSSTMENWSNEFERWSPGLKVVGYYGSQDERKEMRMGWRAGDLEDVDIILTTYNLVSSTPEERRLFRVMPMQYVVFDEAHMLKNMSTIRYENLIRINAKHRILLTGTPLQNNLLELMSLLMFAMPSMFAGKQAELKSLFSKNTKIAAEKSGRAETEFEREQVVNAKRIMKPFILRRLKSEVLQDLPVKTEQVIRCRLEASQLELYQNLVAEFTVEADSNKEVNGTGMMMQLRKLANHPLLIRDYYNETKLKDMAKKLSRDPTYKQKNPDYVFEDLLWMSDYQINQLTRVHKCLAGQGLPQELIPNSGKFQKFDELLPKLKTDGHRVLIFSQFTSMLNIIEDYLAIRGHKFTRLDGQTPVPERQFLIDEFTQNPDIFIFLLSTRAGGLGINLTAADTVIIHDLDFNPYNDKQAEDRCHRVGQQRPVSIIRFIAKDTIEEGMYEMAQGKLNLEQQVTNNEDSENTDKKSVLNLLKMALGLDTSSKSLTLPSTKSTNGSVQRPSIGE
ncbi:SWI/SNF-related matrix-associated actin-dependent regulator of chromatin subfamily A containing DEAD/H box 1 homolog [Neodiprion virginianus]|uniref:SWI/SNF-related matrix-associated actin-dependent regulator of chromatin subfamily A containing DEAD/H box 1 homolog n=1 Tax=Neodiprion virginianus TaxID=2961670 RepID=UPI001EE6E90B|nr:SWI/SNF-related matrix-associated actin-dependent regulator of chromatin subfamily A containing DEAD/H box 1 homolog [Neodiprion virginianus]